MKPQELRIGNYVNFKDRNDILFCEVIGIDKSGYIHVIRNFNDGIQDDQPESIEDITPIPLTEEWLLKFGFLKEEKKYDVSLLNTTTFWKNGLALTPIIDGKRFRTEMCSDYLSDINFDYVHKLQNFFFELKSEELTIKKS